MYFRHILVCYAVQQKNDFFILYDSLRQNSNHRDWLYLNTSSVCPVRPDNTRRAPIDRVVAQESRWTE